MLPHSHSLPTEYGLRICACVTRFELKTLLMHYRDKVEFIEGTPVKDSDLDRVSAKVATAFYLLADQQAKVSPHASPVHDLHVQVDSPLSERQRSHVLKDKFQYLSGSHSNFLCSLWLHSDRVSDWIC